MSDNNNYSEFQLLMEERRNKEQTALLAELKGLLKKGNDSGSLAIQQKIGELTNVMTQQKQTKLDAPEVKVEISTKEIVSSVEKLNQELLVELKKFNERPIPIQFDVEYRYGSLRTVKIIYSKDDKNTKK